jgi:cytochrome d ubiquinol oxidase subunit I
LFTTPWFARFVLWLTPVGVIAIIGGWVTAETGRQPFVVYGLLRTSAAVSHLAPAELVFSVTGFALLYVVLLLVFIAFVVRTVRRGPERDDPALDEPPTGDDDPGLDGLDVVAGMDVSAR